MTRETALVVVLGGIVVIAVIALVFGLGGVTSTSGPARLQPPATPPATGALVSGLIVDEGLSILGVRLRPAVYRVQVEFLVAGECLSRLDFGVNWPVDDPACSSDVPIDGTIGGLGNTAFGRTIVVVEREISEACFDAIDASSGGPWPPPGEDCTR
jgi:hypothetical protein